MLPSGDPLPAACPEQPERNGAPEVQQRLLDCLTAGVCPKCLSLYHFVPFGFVCAIIGSGILALRKHKLPAKLLWGCLRDSGISHGAFICEKCKEACEPGGPAGSVFHTSCELWYRNAAGIGKDAFLAENPWPFGFCGRSEGPFKCPAGGE